MFQIVLVARNFDSRSPDRLLGFLVSLRPLLFLFNLSPRARCLTLSASFVLVSLCDGLHALKVFVSWVPSLLVLLLYCFLAVPLRLYDCSSQDLLMDFSLYRLPSLRLLYSLLRSPPCIFKLFKYHNQTPSGTCGVDVFAQNGQVERLRSIVSKSMVVLVFVCRDIRGLSFPMQRIVFCIHMSLSTVIN